MKADAYGGLEGECKLPADATLGTYWIGVRMPYSSAFGGGNFRVEEYKKPEFEVNVEAPERARHAGREDHGHHRGQVLLRLAGHARQGEVQDHADQPDEPWYPCFRWDWLYGPGYWWFAYDCAGIRAGGTGVAAGRCRSGGRTPSSHPNWSPSET